MSGFKASDKAWLAVTGKSLPPRTDEPLAMRPSLEDHLGQIIKQLAAGTHLPNDYRLAMIQLAEAAYSIGACDALRKQVEDLR